MRPIKRVALFAGVAALLSLAQIAEPTAAQDSPGLRPFYGLLHAHTFFSDGSGTPEEAFAMAKGAGLDFFAVTEHNHGKAEDGAKDRTDGVLISSSPALYEADDPVSVTRTVGKPPNQRTETVTVKSVMRAASDATSDTFVAIGGQEFSTISSGNHVNVFDVPRVLLASTGSFRGLYDELRRLSPAGQPLPVVQFNHPDVQADLFYGGKDKDTIRKMGNDYGIDDEDYGPMFERLVRETDDFVGLVEVISGPAMARERPARPKHGIHENDYYFYLCQGFHVSPSAGQDNHYPTWGEVSDARTGAFCPALTKADLLDAFRQNRTFATEDRDLSLSIAAGDVFMGGTAAAEPEGDVVLTVVVSDPTDGSSSSEVTLLRGEVSPEDRRTATPRRALEGRVESQTLSGAGTATFKVQAPENGSSFFFVRVEQADGDVAWSAPVWVKVGGEEPAEFVWTKSPSSKVYHPASCPGAERIASKNRVTGSEPPAGRHICSCSKDDSDEGH